MYMNDGEGNMILDDNFQNMPDMQNLNDIDESNLEERGEVHFKNGATYTGQWLGNMKHGFGV